MSIKDMVKDKKVMFDFFRDNELWYKTEDGFSFPVPIGDVGKGVMKAEDKAIYYMRWIRKHLETLQEAYKEAETPEREKSYYSTGFGA